MDLKDFLAIGGKPGLYKFISQTKNGIIVESLADGKRMPAYASEKVSALEEIAIFTEAEEVPLIEVFVKIFKKENGGAAISHKAKPEELKSYFAEVLPEYDRERVYVSDMKKVINWYNILNELKLVDGDIKKPEAEEETGDEKDKPADKKKD